MHLNEYFVWLLKFDRRYWQTLNCNFTKSFSSSYDWAVCNNVCSLFDIFLWYIFLWQHMLYECSKLLGSFSSDEIIGAAAGFSSRCAKPAQKFCNKYRKEQLFSKTQVEPPGPATAGAGLYRWFPVGMLLPCSSDFRCFPAGSLGIRWPESSI